MGKSSERDRIITQKSIEHAAEATKADMWFDDLDAFVKVHLYRKYKDKTEKIAKKEIKKLREEIDNELH